MVKGNKVRYGEGAIRLRAETAIHVDRGRVEGEPRAVDEVRAARKVRAAPDRWGGGTEEEVLAGCRIEVHGGGSGER